MFQKNLLFIYFLISFLGKTISLTHSIQRRLPVEQSTPKQETPMFEHRKCPRNFQYYKSNYTDFEGCYFLTEKQTYPPKCPFPNNLPFQNLFTEEFHLPLWSDYHRFVTSNSYGRFESTNWYNYKQPLRDYSVRGNFQGKNCVVWFKNEFKAVNCMERYNALCIYNYPTVKIGENYCKEMRNEKCALSSIDEKQSKCVCENTGNSCTLFEPKDVYQNYVLYKSGLRKDRYLIGMYFMNGKAKWMTDSTDVDYRILNPTGETRGVLDLSKLELSFTNPGTNLSSLCEKNPEIATQGTIFVNHESEIEYVLVTRHFLADSSLYCFEGTKNFNQRFQVNSSAAVFNAPKFQDHYFWCEGFRRRNLKKIVSNVIFVPNGIGARFTMNITIVLNDSTDPYLNFYTENLLTKLKNYLKEEILICPIDSVKPFNLKKFVNAMLITATLQFFPCNRSQIQELEEELMAKITKLREKEVKRIRLKNNHYCFSESTKNNQFDLEWPQMEVGNIALPKIMCFQKDLTPVTRVCLGGFGKGAQWGKVQGVCTQNLVKSKTTEKLLEILNCTKISNENELRTLITTSKEISPYDIELISEIIDKSMMDLSKLMEIIDEIMQLDMEILGKSQRALNSTDRILYKLDKALLKNSGQVTRKTKKMVAWTRDYSHEIEGMTGVAFKNYETIPISKNETIDSVIDKNVDIAVLIPSQVLKELVECTKEPNLKIVILLFQNHSLFASDPNSSLAVQDHIINVLFSHKKYCSTTPFSIVFKGSANVSENICAFWNYGINDKMEKTLGIWDISEIPTYNITTYTICNFTHTTHFGLLMRTAKIPDRDEKNLNIVTAIGCTLSLISCVSICVVKLAVRKLRKRTENAIMINFIFAIAIQIILLYRIDNSKIHTFECTIVTIFTHYIVLAQFHWMLIIGLLQYRKFVQILYNPMQHLILKSCIISWGLPTIPVFILLVFYPESYTETTDLCYLSIPYFYYALLIPVAIIVLMNTIIFILILCSLYHTQSKIIHSLQNTHSDLKLRLYLAMLLLFMLGLTWGFGIAASFFESVFLSYLFCCTASFQAVVMFIFFVPMNVKWPKCMEKPLSVQFYQSSNRVTNSSRTST